MILTSWASDNQSFYEAAGKALAEKPIFMRTITEGRNPKQQKLYDRVNTNLRSKSAFGFSAHGYDGLMLYVSAVKQAGSTDGAKVRAALEDLKTPYDGLMKTYNKPFSATVREGLGAADYKWARWKDGQLLPYGDDVIKSLAAADYKK